MRIRPLTLSLLAALTSSLVAGAALPSSAQVSAPDTEVRTQQFHYDATEIETARKLAKEKRKDKTEKTQRAVERARFAQTSKQEQRKGYTTDQVEVLDFAGDRVGLVLPDDVGGESLDVTVTVTGEGETAVENTVATFDSAVEAGPTAGPGMAPYWQYDGEWQYNLIVRDRGDVLTVARREVLINDGSSTRDYYVYKRRASAQPYDRNLAADARVKTLRISNAAASGTQPYLRTWMDWDPAQSFTGNCDATPYNVSVSAAGAVSFGYNFVDCSGYTISRNINYAGNFGITMEQGTIVGGGDRSAGYAVAYAVAPGGPRTQNDTQSVTFTLSGTITTCGATNASRTC